MEIQDLLEIIARFTKRDFFTKKRKSTTQKNVLQNYETPKTSRNSSVTPSKDENHPKPNQSLRKSSR
ncbi:MAG: hypothetical protein ACWIPJ_02875 [Polaribacter sp.]